MNAYNWKKFQRKEVNVLKVKLVSFKQEHWQDVFPSAAHNLYVKRPDLSMFSAVKSGNVVVI
jgi:hypothetical protein